MSDLIIYTIGHSNHTFEKLVELLYTYSIALVVDVRSSPYSRHNPQFNKEKLKKSLTDAGIDYAFHGASLGGRPDDPACYDDGGINYAKVAEMDWFKSGLADVCGLGRGRVIALLCAEEDPGRCHRHFLLAGELIKVGVKVIHIRGNGGSEEASQSQEQLRLF